MDHELPWDDIRLISIDSGNTLFGMDLDWVGRCLGEQGIPVEVRALERADLAARPQVSRMRIDRTVPVGTPGFELYLGWMLSYLDGASHLVPEERQRIAARLAPHLDGPGQKRFLWSRLLPGVEEALGLMRLQGLRLVLVSNSDGTVEDKLTRYGLRDSFDRVVDSAVVGVRKPDPRIFVRALDGFGIRPEEALHVGDFFHADVLGARAAGLHAVLLDPEDDWSTWECCRLPDLLHLARRLCGSVTRKSASS